MNPQQQKVLDYLRVHPFSTMFDISFTLKLKTSTVDKLLLGLTDQGLVQSQVLFSDKLRRSVRHWSAT